MRSLAALALARCCRERALSRVLRQAVARVCKDRVLSRRERWEQPGRYRGEIRKERMEGMVR